MTEQTWQYFKLEEFACKERGTNKIKPEFVTKLNQLRGLCGFPFQITSGYRSPEHSVEASKPHGTVGKHTLGIAADILVSDSTHRYLILKYANELGFTGIGVSGKFIHLDIRDSAPKCWVY